MPFILSNDTKNDILLASRLAIKNEFSKLKDNFAINTWLKDTNPLQLDTVNTIKNKTFSNDDMSEYIAASAITHLHDAWGFLGQAIIAILNGDTVSARHMAYYSELRSAMSILATEGIGIFNNHHYYIDASSVCHEMLQKKGTHEMLWAVIEHWSTLDKARNLLFSAIKPDNKDLDEWLSTAGIVSLNHLSADIFKYIGVDLQELAKDHDIRNRLSYRPSSIHASIEINTIDNYKFISSLWKHLEPGFDNFDMAMLKQILDLLNSIEMIEKDDSFVEQLLEDMGISDDKKQRLLDYLLSTEIDTIINKAMNTYETVDDAIADNNNHLEVLSRAILLLRIATGTNSSLMIEASVDLHELNFWWQKIFDSKHLISIDDIDSFIFQDLWNDIADIALVDVEEWINPPKDDLKNMKKELSYATILLSEGERAMLWGLSL